MIKEQIAAYELMLDMIKGKTGHISKIPFLPQKQAFHEGEEIQQKFPRSIPEEQGISSRYLASFIQEIAQKKETDIHGIMILRNGYVIGEYSFAPYKKGIWHIEHSMCKSITGMAIGLLIEEGKLSLDDKVIQFFSSRRSFLANVRQKNITVEHLLTMSSGVSFNELGVVSGDDWVRLFLDSPVSGPPGIKFEYNSLNTYMLSAIVSELTGETLVDYLMPRLFEPLGISKIFWESCPKGITKGGWGLFMCQEDAAKLGQLYLQKGRWKGVQLIPEAWVEQSTKQHISTPQEMGNYGYGYQIWQSDREGSFNFNGMLGQNVIVYPDIKMVIVLNAGSDELFQNCILLNIVRKYFELDYTPAEALEKDALAYEYLTQTARKLERGRETEAGIQRGGWKKGTKRNQRKEPDFNHQFRAMNGKKYKLEVVQAGVFPLLMQVFHNNFTDGISKIGFLTEQRKNYLLLWEGEAVLKMEIGFTRAAVSQICVHGEPYMIATKAEFRRDEDSNPVLRINIAYLEEAVRRKIKIVFLQNNRIRVHFDETPGKNLIMEGLSSTMQYGLLKNLAELGNIYVPDLLVEQAIHPVIEGELEENPNIR